MSATETCCIAGCGQPPAAMLDVRRMCRSHFIASCYEQIDEYSRGLEENRFRDTTIELVRRFLADCTRHATDISQNSADLDNLERARLLDILLQAGELGRHLRRSPRKLMNFPVRLSSEKLGRTWDEHTQTRAVSRYGASLACENSVEPEEFLTLMRLDTGVSVRARVAWAQARPSGGHDLGLEFLHCDNFWDIDWTEGEANLWQDEPAVKVLRR